MNGKEFRISQQALSRKEHLQKVYEILEMN
jgi:hypothetical protein